jgi:hypothetical protein
MDNRYMKNLQLINKFIVLVLCLNISVVFAQQKQSIILGKLQTGAVFSFTQHGAGKWGIEISDGKSLNITQQEPAQIEVYQSESNIKEFAAGYNIIRKTDSGIEAIAEIKYNDKVIFQVIDKWSLKGDVASMQRKIEIIGHAPGGFSSAINFHTDSSEKWTDINCLVPGALYGDPTYNGERSPGGTNNYTAKHFFMREDILPAPMFALSFKNGNSITMLDPTPNGESTVAETKLLKDVMTDSRFQFGAFGVWQNNDKPVEFGFKFPAASNIFGFGPGAHTNARWIRRFHPIAKGVVHIYSVSFRFGLEDNYREVTRNSWRWAWSTLKPAITKIDVEQMRKILMDHLAAQANTIDGRTGIPFAVATFDTDKVQWNSTMTGMGFVSKNIECAEQLLYESDRDSTERGKNMRRIGLSIISSMVSALSKVPLEATGYDLATGKPWTGDHQEWLAPWLRNATEDMRVLIQVYRRERVHGILHKDWFNWVKSYVDWLLLQQRQDGSFPRRWKAGTSEVVESTGTTSYCPVPLLIMMSEETGDAQYRESAIRAAEYIWTNFGIRGLYVGGASDNPNITDKEAGMLSMEAFLSLYDSTKDPKWLERAKAAADYAESWIWIWNLPMPVDADNAHLHWKIGVPTIGLQGITALGAGGTDEYLDWAVPSYAKLFRYTNDEHYLDVARVLLHDTKSMVAIPGRIYDMKGIGWQQENFRMGPGFSGRGVGGHRFWLPWVSANHLHGITGLEEFDKVLYKQLSKGN